MRLYYKIVLLFVVAVSLFGFIVPFLLSQKDDLECIAGVTLIFLSPAVFTPIIVSIHRQLLNMKKETP